MGDGADANLTNFDSVKDRERIPADGKEAPPFICGRAHTGKLCDQANLLFEGRQKAFSHIPAEVRGTKGDRILQLRLGLGLRRERVGHFKDDRMRATASGPLTHCA